jgi:hypothetical protein
MLRVFQNKVLRKLFGPKKEKVIGDKTRLHNEELHNLYSSPSNIRATKTSRIKDMRFSRR